MMIMRILFSRSFWLLIATCSGVLNFIRMQSIAVPAKIYTELLQRMVENPDIAFSVKREKEKYSLTSWFDGSDSFNSPYAYSFFLPTGKDNEMEDFRGRFLNILISAHILRQQGSLADFWLFFEITADGNPPPLQEEEMSLLSDLNFHIKSFQNADFDDSTAELLGKVHMTELTQYRRVINIDSDIMLLNSFDDFFELSEGENPVLHPNTVVVSKTNPCKASVFMLEPRDFVSTEFETFLEDYQEDFTEETTDSSSYFTSLFGSKTEPEKKVIRCPGGISQPELMQTVLLNSMQPVTTIFGKLLEDREPDDEDHIQKTLTTVDFEEYTSGKPIFEQDCFKSDNDSQFCHAPYSDFVEFRDTKPWLKETYKVDPETLADWFFLFELWFEELSQIAVGNNLSDLRQIFNNLSGSYAD